MSITKSTIVTSITVTPALDAAAKTAAAASPNNDYPTMTVWTNISIDDPTDDQLPIISNTATNLAKYTADSTGSFVVPTNVTASLMATTGSALVVSIADAIWSY